MIDLLTNALMGMGLIGCLLLTAVLTAVYYLSKSGQLTTLVEKYTKPTDPPPQA
ncbi:hypothetical protein [Frigoriglobus tundricola]|uniref:Uncharacterized protein n=1 Tax=Frigoriglobus tundricola TaxID=2774151 RepID=A0A6M5YLL2_9BACT|nr:hypothetical protein [Frigoriglobus tundricola]QJW94193.1 hypothetical protein FTUN_1712 [Frigoriglobus tundricola]